MKKWVFLFGVLLSVCALAAEVGVISVTREDAHSQKEDFWHTFEYYIIAPGGKSTKCQATRISKKWFATAAHCVDVPCRNGCTLRMDLLEQPVSVFVSAVHTPKKPLVYMHPAYAKDQSVAHDFALLHLDLERLSARYYRRPQGEETKNMQISRAEFDRFLKQNIPARREYDRVLRPRLPSVLTFGGRTGRINRKLSVISIFDGKRQILHNPHPTDYVKELGFAYTNNFGVREGMSGSGVMTNTGELAGIISAYLSKKAGPNKEEYFLFAVFNAELLEFMENIMGSDYYKMERVPAYPGYLVKTSANHREMIDTVRALTGRRSVN